MGLDREILNTSTFVPKKQGNDYSNKQTNNQDKNVDICPCIFKMAKALELILIGGYFTSGRVLVHLVSSVLKWRIPRV